MEASNVRVEEEEEEAEENFLASPSLLFDDSYLRTFFILCD